jgi:hypothetical protein
MLQIDKNIVVLIQFKIKNSIGEYIQFLMFNV